MKKIWALLALAFVFAGCSTTEKTAMNTETTHQKTAHQRRPSDLDIGEQTMKPMNTAFKAIQAEIADGSKNDDVVQKLNGMLSNIDLALTAIPSTDRYNAEAAEVGDTEAQTKYKTLLQSLRVTIHEMIVTVQNKKTAKT